MPTRLPAPRLAAVVLLAVFILVPSCPSPAYSVLTHEQIVDSLWGSDIKKILLEKFPAATSEDLRVAHAYAYGGCLIQDMGYYPYGNKLFSDLVHYVRSGDFVSELIRDSQNINELAFSLGALAHYASDTTGHPAVNEAVSLTFPKLRARYGEDVTYADDPKAHVRTEFGFDVVEVAQQHYTSQAYHDFIGFEVAQPLLDRAFLETYGVPLKEVLPDEDRAIQSYRHALSVWIPRLTQVALITKKKELQAVPNFDPKKFRYILRRAEYEREWGNNYAKPGFGARFLAVIVKILPKVGPLATLDIKTPDRQTEKLYVKSVEQTVAVYHGLLMQVDAPPTGLDDRNLDTGRPTRAAEYTLTDKTYAKLLKQLAKNDYAQMTPALQANLLDFYRDLDRPMETKRHKDDWNEVLRDLEALKKHAASAIPGNF
ncbi:MAG TPA: zinc dependent phospholipase C family protein [Candidatus Angelobacter sp.]